MSGIVRGTGSNPVWPFIAMKQVQEIVYTRLCTPEAKVRNGNDNYRFGSRILHLCVLGFCYKRDFSSPLVIAPNLLYLLLNQLFGVF